jgi:uncharacterized membrane protein YoaK (UPF0700 family)
MGDAGGAMRSSAVPALHKPDAIFSLRHAPSWLLLTMAAGAVNAGAFLACRRFVTHVTGTVTLLGMDSDNWHLMLDYAVVFACFIAGAMTSVLAIDGRYHRGLTPLYALPLVVVTGLLSLVAALGSAGLFGRFGGSVESLPDFAMLSLLSFAMGLQNAAVSTSTGAVVRTTHLTGPATDLGVFLATCFFTAGEERRRAFQRALLRFGKVVGFAIGAALMVPAARHLGYGAFFVPALLVLGATARSFLPASSALEAFTPGTPVYPLRMNSPVEAVPHRASGPSSALAARRASRPDVAVSVADAQG